MIPSTASKDDLNPVQPLDNQIKFPSSPLGADDKDAKAKIYALVNTLTDLNPNMLEIIKPIEESNILLKEITEEIDQLKTKSFLLKLAHLAVLEQRLPDLRTKIDSFISQLESGKNETQSLCVDYGNVIESLKNSALKINENDSLKTDALGIVSVNNLKLKNIQNQIQSAASQIENLERFRSVTLYHLTDTINSTKTDKDLPIVDEIRRLIVKLKVRKEYSNLAAILFFFLAIYNYLADKYHITYNATQQIAQKTSPVSSASGDANLITSVEPFTKLLDIVSTFGAVLGMTVFIFCGFRFLSRQGEISSLIMGVWIGLFSLSVPLILKSFFGVEENSITYVEQTIKVTYDFFNLGATGTIIYLGLFILSFLYAYFKQKEINKYSVVVSKLEKSSALVDGQNVSDLISKNA